MGTARASGHFGPHAELAEDHQLVAPESAVPPWLSPGPLELDEQAAKSDVGKPIPAEASICKPFGLKAVGRVTDRALLVRGAIGYNRHHQVERLYRDARLNWREEGTPTIQHLVITPQRSIPLSPRR